MSITVLLADHSAILRKAIRGVLEDEPEIEIVGEAANFAQTIDLTAGLKPHFVIMDLHMPDRTSALLSGIKPHFSNGSRLLAISLANDEDTKALADLCGAAILLDKAKLGNELIPTMKRLAAA